MKKYWVYVHTCNANGKKYVGVTTYPKPEIRWKEGRGYYQNKHFYSAILKHGWSNFQHEVFEVDSKEEMYRKEVELISFYHSNDPKFGYNNSVGGEKSALGCTRTEETRKKMSEAHKGQPFSEEHKRKMSQARKKEWLDPEIRRKRSEAAKKVQKKVHADPEYRKKKSEAHKKRWSDPGFREKVSEAQKKVHADPEYRKKQSEVAKNRPRIKIKLPDGTIIEITKNNLTRHYINKGRKFEYVS